MLQVLGLVLMVGTKGNSQTLVFTCDLSASQGFDLNINLAITVGKHTYLLSRPPVTSASPLPTPSLLLPWRNPL